MDLNFLWACFAFCMAILLLVVSHELGHFLAARIFGIRVECFSIGFGPKIFQWKSKSSTQYRLSWIPLGGYVKFFETPYNQTEYTQDEQQHAFNRQALWKRSIVILMGPLFSLLFAGSLFVIILLVGFQAPVAKIGAIYPNSPANQAKLVPNDVIIQINERKVANWPQALSYFLRYIGEEKTFSLQIKNERDEFKKTLMIPKTTKADFQPEKDFLGTLGVIPWEPPSPAAVITKISPGQSAAKAGLEINDQIIAINGTPITQYKQLVTLIKKHPEQSMTLLVQRHGERFETTLTPQKRTKFFFAIEYGFAGIEGPPPVWPADSTVTLQYDFLSVWAKAYEMTWDYLVLMCVLLYKLCTGMISFFHLAGPLSIAHIAAIALEQGFVNYLFFLAIFSINLGVINLLPLPGLDGGHLLFYGLEAIRKKPVNPALQAMLIKWAIGASIVLLGHVLSNDLMRISKSIEAFYLTPN